MDYWGTVQEYHTPERKITQIHRNIITAFSWAFSCDHRARGEYISMTSRLLERLAAPSQLLTHAAPPGPRASRQGGRARASPAGASREEGGGEADTRPANHLPRGARQPVSLFF
ncbi:TPA: hypothetical protein BOS_1023 [Bos taurus]|nr:TPA: hypothetical protein BOS_1023 [Bos taurus]